MVDLFSADWHAFDMINADMDAFNADGFDAMDSDIDGFSAAADADAGGFEAVNEYEQKHEPMFAVAHRADTDAPATVHNPGSVLTVSAQAQPVGVAAQPQAVEQQPRDGALCSRSTFFVNADWPSQHAAAPMVGQMYVEKLEPLITMHAVPIILIHGDFHTGQIWLTKPDGKPGWASCFNFHGYRVYVVDLPPCGRSGFAVDDKAQLARQKAALSAAQVERELTAPAHQADEGWPTARLHTQWPGTGRRGDAAFDSYCASLAPLALTKAERQTLAQTALGELLERTGRAVLVGEGTGATMAWLAADRKPHLVAGVVAVEPAGPPCGSADGVRRYSAHLRPAPGVRPYGLADIPLAYGPPAAAGDGPALDVEPQTLANGQGTCMLQRAGGGGRPRQLANLRTMSHVVVTGQASAHSTYDWATVQFLQQAGVAAQRLQLEDYNIRGNGHLLFLERNSDQIASLISAWIGLNVEGGGP